MRRPAAAILGLLALLAVRGATAACTDAFDDLRDELDLRLDALGSPGTREERAERKLLRRVLRRVDRSDTFRKDSRAAVEAVDSLGRQYPSDPVLDGILDGALDGVAADLETELEDLLLTASRLTGGDLKDGTLLLAAGARSDLDDAAAAADRAERAGLLDGAGAAMESAYRGMLRRPDRRLRRTCGDTMLVREDGSLLWRADRVTATAHQASYTFTLAGLRARNPVDESELQLEVKNFAGRGTYQLAYGSGRWREAGFTKWGIVAGGTLVVTRFDAPTGVVEGTFSFTARGCLFDCSAYEVTDGSFRMVNLRIL